MGSHWKKFLYYRKFCVTTIKNNPNSVWLISFFPKLDHVFPMNIARFESHHGYDLNLLQLAITSKLTFTSSKSLRETLKKGVKYVQS